MNYTEEEAEALLKVMGVDMSWGWFSKTTLYTKTSNASGWLPFVGTSRSTSLNSAIQFYLTRQCK